MLVRMAKESGVETPTIDDLFRLDRKRKGKKLSNEDWTSKTDPEAKIAKMKDGSTHLACKPEHAVDLDTGVIVAAQIHEADQGDTATLDPTLREAENNLSAVGLARPCCTEVSKGVTAPSWNHLLNAHEIGLPEFAHSVERFDRDCNFGHTASVIARLQGISDDALVATD
jgi:hypothetical protein